MSSNLRGRLPWVLLLVGSLLLLVAGQVAAKDWPRANNCLKTESGPCSAPATYGDQDAIPVVLILALIGVCMVGYGVVRVLRRTGASAN